MIYRPGQPTSVKKNIAPGEISGTATLVDVIGAAERLLHKRASRLPLDLVGPVVRDQM